MNRESCIKYVEMSIQLHGCVIDAEELQEDLDEFLRNRLGYDYDDDIEVTIEELLEKQ